MLNPFQDTRLDNRVLDLRTPANQSIYRLQVTRDFLSLFLSLFLPLLLSLTFVRRLRLK